MTADSNGADWLPEAVWWYRHHVTLHVHVQLKRDDHSRANIVNHNFHFDCTCLISSYQLSKMVTGTLCALSFDILLSYWTLLKSFHACAPTRGPATLHLVKFRWKQEWVELGFDMFIGSDDFSLFMFFKHSAAKPRQKRFAVLNQMFEGQWFISLCIITNNNNNLFLHVSQWRSKHIHGEPWNQSVLWLEEDWN